MRKYALVAILALAGSMTLAACSNKDADQQAAPAATQQAAAPAAPTRPTDPTDQTAWSKYLGYVLSQHLQGMTATRPYAYIVPAGASTAISSSRERQLDNVTGVVLRGVTPGNLLAFGGPSSKQTADFITKAFQQATPGSMKGVIVMFIGDEADKQRVGDAIQKSDAIYRFVQM